MVTFAEKTETEALKARITEQQKQIEVLQKKLAVVDELKKFLCVNNADAAICKEEQ